MLPRKRKSQHRKLEKGERRERVPAELRHIIRRCFGTERLLCFFSIVKWLRIRQPVAWIVD